MPQLPFYKTGEREMGAPDGFQPQQLTQANNGGPMGLGQPARATPQAANPTPHRPAPRSGPPVPAPPQPGTGQPPFLYGPPAAAPVNPAADLWASRNSRDPVDLIVSAFMSFQGRAPQPVEIQTLLQAPNTDALVQQLLNLQNPGQLSPVQQAIIGPR